MFPRGPVEFGTARPVSVGAPLFMETMSPAYPLKVGRVVDVRDTGALGPKRYAVRAEIYRDRWEAVDRMHDLKGEVSFSCA